MITVTLPDGSQLDMPDCASAADVAARIGPGLAKAALAARADFGAGEVVLDLAAPLKRACKLSILTAKDAAVLPILRHSTAHVMAEAICKLWPQTLLVYGPPIEGGFYYDIDLDHRLTPEDFTKIESEMAEIVAQNRPFTRYELSRAQAMKKLETEGNPYKLENALRAEGDTLSFYVTGSEAGADWEDLCKGTHIPSTGRIGAFKVLNVSGAFLHGDASKKQLQRVTGTAFHSKKELAEHLTRLEEAKKRDHRRIGQELGLFALDPMVGTGLVLWKPKGAIVRNLLEAYLRKELVRHGYEPVYSPNIGRLELYRTSGHFPYYKEGNYPPMYDRPVASLLKRISEVISEELAVRSSEERRAARLREAMHPLDTLLGLEIRGGCCTQETLDKIEAVLAEEEGYLLKPMNCPHHIRIYASEPRSYRDLPVRLAEFGTVYRYEQSGEVSGLTRVRGFTQDDAHLFCTPEQLQEELAKCLELTRFVLDSLSLKDYRVRIGLHDPKDPKFIDNPQGWAEAEAAIKAAADASGMAATIEVGEAAFYGPKIDFVVKDCIGREWQLGTVQVDYNLPKRFKLEYAGKDNRLHRPIMIHRAPFGSMERFLGILIEHFEGAFPTWLAPVQVLVATISEKSAAYARELIAGLRAAGIRAELDDSPERIGPKKHKARQRRIPYIAVVGEQEAANRTVNVNDVEGRQLDDMRLDLFVEMLLQQSEPPGAGSMPSSVPA